jgi:hypothetical protein
MNASNLSAADALIAERVVSRTKQQYESKIKAIALYYTNHLDCEFTVPVQRVDILRFFGWLIDEKHKDTPLAISSVAYLTLSDRLFLISSLPSAITRPG